MIHDQRSETCQHGTTTQLFQRINDVRRGVLGCQEQKALRVNANDLKVFLVMTQAMASSPQDSWGRWKISELNGRLTGCFLQLSWWCPLPSEGWLYFAFCRPALLVYHPCVCLETPPSPCKILVEQSLSCDCFQACRGHISKPDGMRLCSRSAFS